MENKDIICTLKLKGIKKARKKVRGLTRELKKALKAYNRLKSRLND